MTLEELAMHLAPDMGRGVFIGQPTKTIILKACLRNAGLASDDALAVRLEDMIENLTAEVWNDWHEKRDMAGARAQLAPENQEGDRG